MRRTRRRSRLRWVLTGAVALGLGVLLGLGLSYISPPPPPAAPPPQPFVVKVAPPPPHEAPPPAPVPTEPPSPPSEPARRSDDAASPPPAAALPPPSPPMAPEPPAPPEARPASADAKAPAKVPAKEPKAATGSAKRAGGEAFNYTIHVESFQSPRKAQERVQILKKAGLDAFSREVTVPGKGPYHRIFVGRYADRAQALASAEGLRGKHGIPAGARVVAASQMDR